MTPLMKKKNFIKQYLAFSTVLGFYKWVSTIIGSLGQQLSRISTKCILMKENGDKKIIGLDIIILSICGAIPVTHFFRS